MPERALVSNIQRYSLDDGPGIRTTVFLKGCPLACKWCHNPECIPAGPSLFFFPDKCAQCRSCAAACPNGAHEFENGHSLNREKCIACGSCARVCPYGACEAVGKTMSAEELLPRLLRDLPYYERSGGGVTLSGGEALLQRDFCVRIARLLKEKGIHIAIDTCGDVPWESFEAILPHADLFLYDLKTASDGLHRTLTGRGNGRIRENFARLAAAEKRIIVRIPLVSGVNDAPDELRAIAEFIRTCNGTGNIALVELLAYHAMGTKKYAALGKAYAGTDYRAPAPEKLAALAAIFEEYGIPVQVHGSEG